MKIYFDLFLVSLPSASERPAVLKNPFPRRRNFISSRLPDELLIVIAAIVGLVLLVFIIFLVYHFRNQKTLRQTLLATRILATRGISNLKSVSRTEIELI